MTTQVTTKPAYTITKGGNIRIENGFDLGGGQKLDIICPVITDERWENWVDEVPSTFEVDGDFFFSNATGRPSLSLDLFALEGIYIEVEGDLSDQLEEAVDGTEDERIAATVALIEYCSNNLDSDMINITDSDVCALNRISEGITLDDLLWEEPGLAGYGAHEWAVRVYRTRTKGRLMVCSESERKNEGEAVTGYITGEQYDSLEHDPTNYRGTMHELMDLAGISDDNDA